MYEALKYIHEHIKEDLVLSEIADKFGYSKWHFSSKFHKYTGSSFSKYIRHFRLQLAALDILADRKLIDVALEYGYESIGGFNKAFVSEFGCYPCAASPDGRRKGEIMAYSLSPMQGRDFNGLTSLFNSLSKLPTKRTPGTTSAIVEIDPKLFTDRNIPLLASILFAAGAQGLQNVQFNTIDANILMDAKLHPEKHKNLAVRVSGFSQKFNLLQPELQDHIISRTKHSCM